MGKNARDMSSPSGRFWPPPRKKIEKNRPRAIAFGEISGRLESRWERSRSRERRRTRASCGELARASGKHGFSDMFVRAGERLARALPASSRSSSSVARAKLPGARARDRAGPARVAPRFKPDRGRRQSAWARRGDAHRRPRWAGVIACPRGEPTRSWRPPGAASAGFGESRISGVLTGLLSGQQNQQRVTRSSSRAGSRFSERF